MIEDLPSCPWHNSHLSVIKNVFTVHGEGLSTPGLTISKYCPIVTLHDIFYHLTSNDPKDFLLTDDGLENMIEGKSQIRTLSVKFFNQSDSLFIVFIKRYNLTLVWIEFLDLLLYGVVWTESRNYFNTLPVSFVHIR